MKKLTIGTRGSNLALRQTHIVIDELQKKYPNCKFHIKIIKTLGDKIVDTSLTKVNDKGFFVREIQEQLINKKIDIAVHSLKDMPFDLEKTKICAILEREDNKDVLVSNMDTKISKLKSTDLIGTTSIRRKIQIRNLNKNVKITDIRGNVDTRVKKMISGECNALVLAAAGVNRLGLEKYVVQHLNKDTFLPAPGQGAIAIEGLKENLLLNKFISEVNHENSYISTHAERIFMSRIGGGCHMPFGCFAQINNNEIMIYGMIASIKNFKIIRKKITGKIDEYKSLSEKLAFEITQGKGHVIMNELKNISSDK